MELPSPATPLSLGRGPLRRRNGRQQACEPCRKRKVACDHGYPVCVRCTKRSSPSECIYLPPTAQGSTRRSPVVRGEPVTAPTTAPTTATTTPGSELSGRQLRSTDLERVHGYLGYTSFSAVYQEAQTQLNLSEVGLSQEATPANQFNSSFPLPPLRLEKSLIVLRHVPTPEEGPELFDRHINPNDGWIRLAARRSMESLYDSFGSCFTANRDNASLERLARLVSANTMKPWSETEPNSDRWLESFSGDNIRWETIGILFTYWSIAAGALDPHRPEPFSEHSMHIYHEMVGLCVELCKGVSDGNSLLLYMIYKEGILNSILIGDASPAFCRSIGESVALTTFLGMHAEQPSADYKPTAATEARRRLFAQIFIIDKVAAAFSGRPPVLSRRYVTTPLPLDLSDEALLSDEETLTRAMQSLDRGWNTDGKIHSTTIVRARHLLCHHKDEVMEIALGNPAITSAPAVVHALLNLKTREIEVAEQLPDILKYSPDDVTNIEIEAPVLYTKILVRLEHLENLFLTERLLAQRGHDSQADLLAVSFDMVSLTLVFWTHMDRLVGLHGDYEGLVMSFAAPPGGVLCNELLRPSHSYDSSQRVTRSGIIQQLSLLVGFLDWVKPASPNGDMCKSCKMVIQRVLDHSLNNSGMAEESTLNTFDFEIPANLNEHFNFELLDTFDWLRSDLGSSQQSG